MKLTLRRLAGIGLDGNPLAISWLIVPIVIDAVNCEVVRVAVAVCPVSESGKAIPFSAYLDSSASVVREFFVIGISAPASHCVIGIVQARPSTPVPFIFSSHVISPVFPESR